MYFWRGWGVLAIVLIGIAAALIGAIPEESWGESAAQWATVGIGVGAGALCWIIGYYLNVLRPKELAEAAMPAIRDEVLRSVHDGTFQLPDQAPPNTPELARAQAEHYLETEAGPALLESLRNRHSVAGMALQHWAFIILGWAVLQAFVFA
ncbi:MAG: hypothetical protein QM713_04340 [Arachnia sp.]